MPGLFAHGLHLLLVVLGLVGVAVLLLPQVRTARARRTTLRAQSVAARHEERVAAQGSTVQSRQLTSGHGASAGASATTRTARDSSTWRAVAVSSSVAAAGVHAAVFPHHLEESFVVGAFFLVVTLGQAAWACLVFLEASRARLVAGIVASLGLVALWGMSRTFGLPFVGRESVGGWDLAAGAWELALVAACLPGLRRPPDERGLVLGGLGRVAWAWAVLSGVALVLLTLTVAQH